MSTTALMKSTQLCFFYCAAALLLLSGCLPLQEPGPVLIPPPLPVLREVNIEVMLFTRAAASVPSVTVVGQSKFSTASDVTGSDGKAHLKVLVSETERSAHFHFSGPGINWLESIENIPATATEVKAAFTVEESGAVRLSAVEF